MPDRTASPTATLTDDTPLLLKVAGDRFATTAGLFFGDNDDDAFDRGAAFAALSKGEVYRGGGGAQPEWSVEIAL